jgi:hypothetical protein
MTSVKRSASSGNLNMIGPVTVSVVIYATETFIKQIFCRSWSTSSPQRIMVLTMLMGRIFSDLWVEILTDVVEDLV